MIIPHGWRECRPALLTLHGHTGPDAEHAVETVWATLGELDRQAWHRVCCQRSRAPGDLTITHRITTAVREQPVTPVTPSR
jgi:hypothetical protein